MLDCLEAFDEIADGSPNPSVGATHYHRREHIAASLSYRRHRDPRCPEIHFLQRHEMTDPCWAAIALPEMLLLLVGICLRVGSEMPWWLAMFPFTSRWLHW